MVEGQGYQDVGTTAANSEQPPNRLPSVKAPRGWWWDFILHGCTFGLYTAFWLVGRLREVRSLTRADVTPWLWFFVPHFVLAQLFALPRLVGYLRQLESEYGVPAWGRSRQAWMAAVILVTAFFNIQERIATPFWTVLPALLVWAALFTVLEVRFNAVKRRLDNVAFRERKYGYSWWEWLIAAPMVCVTFIFVPYLSLGSLGMYDVSELPADQAYVDPEERFRFPVPSEGWVEVEPGTYSEDEALLELRGPIEDVYAIVYHYENIKLEGLAYDRLQTFHETLWGASCEEFRRFQDSRLSVVSQVICTGREMNMPSMLTSAIVESPQGLFELIIHMNTPRLSFQDRKAELLRMTREFESL
ncbi:MAG: hypothetical protein R6W86_09330 [Marinobacter sp.]|uniref:hypothetical protein n=1 Tax=Marinobacter sp. TaxID=50741 RepID=UPI00396DC60D